MKPFVFYLIYWKISELLFTHNLRPMTHYLIFPHNP
ncbi:hypothetical protein Desac_1667 [Desulfobacca acetoxidans DSM 11109]|uniref:Uncharacterized protein n=1 Tax=Desulfobacca acetoxidans (strain ATCC 700848 / DSM 11109 / ASRB2) TaxID=880072 RepID=F2NJK2_DESAR|nr:hypothetical protein Desac_1667 [Desulfobacca acetoxidans DSM 11109]